MRENGKEVEIKLRNEEEENRNEGKRMENGKEVEEGK